VVVEQTLAVFVLQESHSLLTVYVA